MGGSESLLLPTPNLNIAFSHGFLYLELEKQVYYPGESIKGNVHLLINQTLDNVNSLDLKLKGKETFKYTTLQKKEDNSTRNSFLIFDNSQTLCQFFKGSIAVGQYSFKFCVELPLGTNGQLVPASFIQRQTLQGKGILKARIRYSLEVSLKGGSLEHPSILTKFSKRFFIAQIPVNAKENFRDRQQQNVNGLLCQGPKGYNIIETQFERNYYLTDEVINTKTRVDNSQCEVVCNKIICKLVRSLTCTGNGGHVIKTIDTVCRAEVSGVAPREATIAFQKDIQMILNDQGLKFDVLRTKKLKYFKPEDLKFAKYMQPSTRGNCIECTYALVVTREFNNPWFQVNDVPGISTQITLNPGKKQLDTSFIINPPPFWNPNYIDCETVSMKVLTPLNRSINPYERRNYGRRQVQQSNSEEIEGGNEGQQSEERRPLIGRGFFR